METVWHQVGKTLPGLLAISLLAALLAAGTVVRMGDTWAVHFSYVVSLQEREATNAYRFDGYYALQALESFTKTLAEWIVAPEMVAQAHRAAGLPEPTGITKVIEAEAAAAQLVRVTVQAGDRAQAEKLAAGLQAVVTQQLQRYEAAGVPAVQFRVVATEPWGTHAGLNKKVVSVATGILVFFVGLNLVVLRESLRYGHRG